MTLNFKPNEIYFGDCFEVLPQLPDQSVDAFISDLPYGTTNCTWDKKLNLPVFWGQLKRIVRPGGAIVTTANQPFTTELINSNRDWFRYELIYSKGRPTGFLDCNQRPLRSHENILIFCDQRTPTVYNPQKVAGKPYKKNKRHMPEVYSAKVSQEPTSNLTGERHPGSVLRFSISNFERGLHPTQKPLELYEWLVRTYTNQGDLVLDCFGGSGTTAAACKNTGRQFVLVEKDQRYYEKARQRLGLTLT